MYLPTNLGVAKGATQLAGYSYLLDNAGHRLSVTELSSRTVMYGYDCFLTGGLGATETKFQKKTQQKQIHSSVAT